MSILIESVAGTLATWATENNAGNGEPIGEPEDSPVEAAKREGLEIVDVADQHSESAGSCLVRSRSGNLVLICDVHGPWACTVAEAGKHGQTLEEAIQIASSGESVHLHRAARRLHGLSAFGMPSESDGGPLGQAYRSIVEDLPADRQYTVDQFIEATTTRKPNDNAADTYIALID